MIKNKNYLLKIILGIFLISSLAFISSANSTTGSVSYCCEKTTSGAWCQNAQKEECNPSFKSVPSSCEATSYCRMGTCYDNIEGICMENTPQKVCEEASGVWSDKSVDKVPQCQLGCCLIGDQAAFVTQTRCKRLSSLYGLEIDFRTQIKDEATCVASATSEVQGACVFEKDFERTCKRTTQKACNEMKTSGGNESASNAEFHEGYLCSAPQLNTECSGQKGTTCVEEKDEVYFVDLCGNMANIYDSSKTFDKDKDYWTKIYDRGESCNPSSSNANSASCGNCNYYLGSTCKEYERLDTKKPDYGNNICKDLACNSNGKAYQHGETWCAESQATTKITIAKEKGNIATENLPGSRYYRMVCYNNEVTVEPCEDFRNEVCLQGSLNGFSMAGCVVNKWQDCNSQKEKKDCENTDKRDCRWVEDAMINVGTLGENANQTTELPDGACVPKYTPGLNFYGTEGVDGGASGEAEQVCSQATVKCVVKWKITKGLIGSEKKECLSGCECIASGWEDKMNEVCNSLGDCGVKKNFLGIPGYNTETGAKSSDKNKTKDDKDKKD